MGGEVWVGVGVGLGFRRAASANGMVSIAIVSIASPSSKAVFQWAAVRSVWLGWGLDQGGGRGRRVRRHLCWWGHCSEEQWQRCVGTRLDRERWRRGGSAERRVVW